MNSFLIDNEKKKISKELIKWCYGKEKFLNIVTTPYNSSNILYEIILSNLETRKKVLYVTDENENDIEIIDLIKKYSKFRNYMYIRENYEENSSSLVITKSTKFKSINGKFDLIIYNGISSVIKVSYNELIKNMIRLINIRGKIISYNFECIFNGNKEIILPIRDNGCPLVEPTLFKTKIDLNKDIPYVAYEYIKWSLESSRKVVIYVPDIEKVKKVYNYLFKYCKNLAKDVYCFFDNGLDDKEIKKFLNRKKTIIITNDYKNKDLDISNINVMVFFADNILFNYKKLVYICGKVGRKEKRHSGEVIFIAKDENIEIEKSKNIIRNFNKEAWEMKLLKMQNIY
ncbi:hypothetical protein SH2C18_08980 [Clostridium sediminicola]|uniref:hypothetical protein n=1 Tax=Clostridium sediminicola TaxID=3114879 RepID=UPI0031F24A3E